MSSLLCAVQARVSLLRSLFLTRMLSKSLYMPVPYQAYRTSDSSTYCLQTVCPQSIMPIISQNSRPPFRYAESFSSSLQGLEQVLPRRSSLFDVFKDTEGLSEKPLPRIPNQRKSSSVYSTQTAEILDAYTERRSEEKQPTLEASFVPALYITDAVTQTSSRRSRPILEENGYQTYTNSKPTVATFHAKVRTPELSKPQVHSAYQVTHSSGSKIPKDRREEPVPATNTIRNFNRADLESFSTATSTYQIIQDTDHGHSRGLRSSRPTEVVDHSLVPLPLSISKIDHTDRPSSHFSMTSTDIEESSFHNSRSSFQSYAHKVKRRRQGSPEESDNGRATSFSPNRNNHMPVPAHTTRDRFRSISSQRRASIQKGLSTMYDTLTGLSIRPSRLRSTVTASARSPIPREARSPAIPVTPYQRMGKKAWETPPQTPKLKTTKKSRFSFFPDSRNAVAMDATKRPTVRKTESEKRREALKKNIVLIGPTDQYQRM